MNLERNYKLKRVLLLSLCVLVLFELAGCREKRSVSFENDISGEIIDYSTESQISAGELEKTEITDKSAMDDEREYMKLYFNDTEIPGGYIEDYIGDVKFRISPMKYQKK